MSGAPLPLAEFGWWAVSEVQITVDGIECVRSFGDDSGVDRPMFQVFEDVPGRSYSEWSPQRPDRKFQGEWILEIPWDPTVTF